ncbi:MAG: electron transport complex subunit RsxG [Pseudomonadota bacterium]|nr:electron transport complex subunit RsxG [Pseudomonadota bacterium]
MTEHENQTPEADDKEPTIGGSIVSNGLLLGLFALVTATLLAGTYSGTAERIAAAERANAQKALLEVVPVERHNNDLLETTESIDEDHWQALGLKQGGDWHIATQDGAPIAVIMPAVAPDGYSGDIKMIIGINTDGTIAGVRVLTHNETPGLGDKVELRKDDWILSFDGKSLQNPSAEQWGVKKDGGDFDQFTGATITPRAVVNQVKRALEVFQKAQPLAPQHKSALQHQENTSTES